MLAMAKTITRPRGRPRRPTEAPRAERTTYNLPPGTRDRILRAIALQTVLGDEAPADATAFVISAVNKLVGEIEARARARGVPVP